MQGRRCLEGGTLQAVVALGRAEALLQSQICFKPCLFLLSLLERGREQWC